MTPLTRTFLHAFLRKRQGKQSNELLNYLASPEKEAICPETYGNPLDPEQNKEHLLNSIHNSWIVPFLRTLPEKEIAFFLSCFTPEKAASLAKDLLYTGRPPSLSPLGKQFIQTTILRYLTAEIEELLPIECLPASPLNDLSGLSTNTLVQLINLLGLHDLSIELKQIIDKQKLSKIYEVLNENERNYLKSLLQAQEPAIFSPMGLINWNGAPETLTLMIEQRGINRLSKALYGGAPSLIWYILHRLDVEKALLMRKLSTPLDHPRTLQNLIDQVVILINYTRKSHD